MAAIISMPAGCTFATCPHILSQVCPSRGKPLLLTRKTTPPSLSSSSEPPLLAVLMDRACVLLERPPFSPLEWGLREALALDPVIVSFTGVSSPDTAGQGDTGSSISQPGHLLRPVSCPRNQDNPKLLANSSQDRWWVFLLADRN